MFDITTYQSTAPLYERLAADAERLSGLPRKGAALPRITDANDDYSFEVLRASYELAMLGALGVYTNLSNPDPEEAGTLVYDSSRQEPVKTAATLIHELTHWLQDVNGLMPETGITDDIRAGIEEKAYSTQRAWLAENGVDPDSDPNLAAAFFQKVYHKRPVWAQPA